MNSLVFQRLRMHTALCMQYVAVAKYRCCHHDTLTTRHCVSSLFFSDLLNNINQSHVNKQSNSLAVVVLIYSGFVLRHKCSFAERNSPMQPVFDPSALQQVGSISIQTAANDFFFNEKHYRVCFYDVVKSC